jgi:hypothetical protein
MKLLYLCLLLAVDQRSALDDFIASGQIVEIATPSSERLAPPARIAPGPPPTLGFRLIEGKLRHRFGDLDLVLDDAGH